jgi:PIN domain nuclease of toxin-antitoxin system
MGGFPEASSNRGRVTDLLADTHVVVWALFEPNRLSSSARNILLTAESTGSRVYLSAITLVEITYLAEKGRLHPDIAPNLWAVLQDVGGPFEVLPITAGVARAIEQVPREVVPDMPDRLIAASAIAFGLPLVTADRRLRSLPPTLCTVLW